MHPEVVERLHPSAAAFPCWQAGGQVAVHSRGKSAQQREEQRAGKAQLPALSWVFTERKRKGKEMEGNGRKGEENKEKEQNRNRREREKEKEGKEGTEGKGINMEHQQT